MDNQTLLLIDGFNLLSRGYFATSYGKEPEQLTKSSKGVYTNALRIFFQKTFHLISQYKMTHLAVVWDVKKDETTRRLKHDFYKATRSDLPDPLIQQFETCKEVLEGIGIQQISVPAYEADDVIGTLAKKWCKNQYGHCYIYSNDKDLFQLLSSNISQIIGGKKGDSVYSLQHFQDDYCITPEQWIDVKALLGDKSDNIPGCPGIGEKSALPLIQLYGSIEHIYEQMDVLDPRFNRYKNKLIEGKNLAFISKELSAIICQMDELNAFLFDDLQVKILKERVMAEFNELELKMKYA
ncbi:flap endonuclease [Domibacillus antri]|uniref:5'-3' exonuclease n=1 Tax=Domibacillus antri TaxID=1714264 RepID=A0A1Q8Q773_9BACI|nr:5'-3' exonuclease H3TH domain-containing protein [Domibacillus antri]OLN23193.1 flap endonuclease [Domibacillus antri]